MEVMAVRDVYHMSTTMSNVRDMLTNATTPLLRYASASKAIVD